MTKQKPPVRWIAHGRRRSVIRSRLGPYLRRTQALRRRRNTSNDAGADCASDAGSGTTTNDTSSMKIVPLFAGSTRERLDRVHDASGIRAGRDNRVKLERRVLVQDGSGPMFGVRLISVLVTELRHSMRSSLSSSSGARRAMEPAKRHGLPGRPGSARPGTRRRTCCPRR